MNILNASVLYTEAFLFHQVGQELAANGVKLRQVTEMAYARDVLRTKGAEIDLIRDRMPALEGDLAEAVARVEARYSIDNLRSLLVGDRYFASRPESDGLSMLIRYIQYWERELEERPVDAIFMDFGGELIRRSLFLVARKLGIQAYYLNFAPFSRSIAWIDNEFNHWDDYVPRTSTELSADELAAADEFMAKLRSSAVQFTNVLPLSVSTSRLGKLAEYLRIQWRHEHGGNVHFCPERWLGNFLSRSLNRLREKRFIDTPREDEHFVLFPLHVTDDAQLTVRAPHINQEELIRQIARTLPHGYKLYVKGHPSYIGGYDWRMLARLALLPNVRFIDPFVHAHTLLRKAAAVIVVNSTTGFEALVYGLPLLVFGPTYYRGQGLTYDVTSYAELEAKLAEALREPSPATNEGVRTFLANLRRACYPGSAYYMYGTGSQMTPSQLEANAAAFARDAAEMAASLLAKLDRTPDSPTNRPKAPLCP